LAEVLIRAAPDASVPRNVFAGVSTRELVSALLAHVAMRPDAAESDEPGAWPVVEWRESTSEAERVAAFDDIRRRTRPRRSVTRARVEEAARAYSAAIDAGERAPIKSVAAALGVGDSMAARIVGLARTDEYELLPPTTRGKARA
jgi:hypothetical protein